MIISEDRAELNKRLDGLLEDLAQIADSDFLTADSLLPILDTIEDINLASQHYKNRWPGDWENWAHPEWIRVDRVRNNLERKLARLRDKEMKVEKERQALQRIEEARSNRRISFFSVLVASLGLLVNAYASCQVKTPKVDVYLQPKGSFSNFFDLTPRHHEQKKCLPL